MFENKTCIKSSDRASRNDKLLIRMPVGFLRCFSTQEQVKLLFFSSPDYSRAGGHLEYAELLRKKKFTSRYSKIIWVFILSSCDDDDEYFCIWTSKKQTLCQMYQRQFFTLLWMHSSGFSLPHPADAVCAHLSLVQWSNFWSEFHGGVLFCVLVGGWGFLPLWVFPWVCSQPNHQDSALPSCLCMDFPSISRVFPCSLHCLQYFDESLPVLAMGCPWLLCCCQISKGWNISLWIQTPSLILNQGITLGSESVSWKLSTPLCCSSSAPGWGCDPAPLVFRSPTLTKFLI